ncbi:flavodoxin-like protein [Biostraticola tofi]|uniref:Flavodoxin-like protein n=1 Tax=Biostraticola tofi TaxID=466109 RepID=A0A4R3YSL0_9GAMM|nr:flavodoxin-like protein [Biostraticola tofi]
MVTSKCVIAKPATTKQDTRTLPMVRYRMNVLIILAHPEPHSFNAHLSDQADQLFSAQGHRVDYIDLYQEDFDPRESAGHYPARQDEQRFDPMQAQRQHWKVKRLPPDIQRYIDLLQQADRLIR